MTYLGKAVSVGIVMSVLISGVASAESVTRSAAAVPASYEAPSADAVARTTTNIKRKNKALPEASLFGILGATAIVGGGVILLANKDDSPGG